MSGLGIIKIGFGFFLKHWQWLVVALMVAGLVGFGYYIKGIQAKNKELETKIHLKEEQILKLDATVQQIIKEFESQKALLEQYSTKLSEIQTEAKENVKIFKEHNLQNLSDKKPGLIEKRVNKATQKVFETLVKDTQEFYEEVK